MSDLRFDPDSLAIFMQEIRLAIADGIREGLKQSAPASPTGHVFPVVDPSDLCSCDPGTCQKKPGRCRAITPAKGWPKGELGSKPAAWYPDILYYSEAYVEWLELALTLATKHLEKTVYMACSAEDIDAAKAFLKRLPPL